MGKLGLVGGTGLLAATPLRHTRQREVTTPYGRVALLETSRLVFLQRHGLEEYTPPHRINHAANLHALKESGVERILAVGSVGSLQRDIPPGRFLVPDDFYAPQVNPTYYADSRGHRTPGFDPAWRATLLDTWRGLGLPACRENGVYWQTSGPRFETPAEIRFHQSVCHVVGMTIASECILAAELDLPYAALCLVDNYANGLEWQPLTFEGFKAQVKQNEAQLLSAIDALTTALIGNPS
ncbi:MAG: MTAP family purine nucleoside phosphorylase [Magnetococcales bacterium]|nr:MTAP family purine nucleoside phosphorylase [Magnetococcales bacterium]